MKSMSKKAKLLFNPRVISTEIHEAIQRDLEVDLTSIDHSLLYSGRYDAKTIYAYRQVSELLKKYSDDSANEKVLHDAACADFISRNVRLGQHLDDLDLPNVGTGLSECRSAFHVYLLRARLIVHEILQDFDTEKLFTCMKHSSGTSLGLKYSETNIENKFQFPLTTTESAMRHFMNYLEWDPQMKKALIDYNQNFDFSLVRPVGRLVCMDGILFDVVKCSRLTTVAKDDKKRRVIALEPTVPMFGQQGIMRMMTDALFSYLDIESLQPIHQKLAYLGSILPERIATIDFSNASDSLGIELVRFLLPRQWFLAVMAFRTPYTAPSGEDPVYLRMIGTMGNATTFPLETLVFYALAIAVQRTHHESILISEGKVEWRNVSVFGDDCIVPTFTAEVFMSLCKYCGFQVNDDKSFFKPETKFRESCGADFYAGRNVRPYYLRAPHNTKLSSLEPWLYIIMNRILEKYIEYFGYDRFDYDRHAIGTIFALFRRYDICVKIVPDDYPDDSGLKIWKYADSFKQHIGFLAKTVKWSPIYQSEHGTYMFKFCRFQYSEKSERSNSVSYWRALKFPTVSDPWEPGDRLKMTNTYVNKRVGGYVVSKGLSFQIME